MKKFLSFIIIIVIGNVLALDAYSQSYNNSLRVQYGLMQYNKSSNETIKAGNDYFLNTALTYRLRLGSVSGLNLTGRYYKWQLTPENQLKTYAAQAMWVLHPRKISSSWTLNRLTPYLGVGLGIEKHELERTSINDTSFSNVYMPVEAGILFNLSSRWSIGIFAEYKFAAEANFKKLVNEPSGSLDLVNAGGVSLAYHFGKRSKQHKVPVVFTLPMKNTPAAKPVSNPDLTISPINKKVKAIPAIDTTRFSSTVKEEKVKNKIDDLDDGVKAEVIDEKKKSDKFNESAIKDSKMDNITVVDTGSSRKVARYSSLKDSLESTMPQISLESDLDIKGTDEIFNAEKQNTKKTDSLLRVIEKLSQVTKPEILSEGNRNTAPDELMEIKPVENNYVEDPELIRLKLSYNQLTELIERNNRRGYMKEAEVQNLRMQTNQIRENIYTVNRENNLNADEVAKLQRIISEKQAELNKAYSAASIENNLSDNNINVESSINDIQVKLDTMLLELKGLKQQQLDGFQQQQFKGLMPPPASILAKNTESNLEFLVAKQFELENKITQIEKNNLLLIRKIDSINAKPKKATPLETKEIDNLLYTVYFDNNSSAIKTIDLKALRKIADSVKNNKGDIILLSGFSDKSGNAAYNLKLSHRRVTASKKVLLANGLTNGKIIERYFGSNRASGENAESDRKVVIRIFKN